LIDLNFVETRGSGLAGDNVRRKRLKDVDGTPMLLTSELSSWLPWVINVGEHDGLSTDAFRDRFKSNCLSFWTWAGLSVTCSCRWPSGLQVDTSLSWAKSIDDVKLGLDERSSSGSLDISVEEWVNVATDNINGTAESTAVCLPGVEGLGSGALSRVSGSGKLGLGIDDEASKSTGGAVTVEDGLVTDNNKINEGEFTPADDVAHLLGSFTETRAADENTNDHTETGSLTSSANVDKSGAVGAVDTDDRESSGLDNGDIRHDR
jgi:hypothetical protein